MKAVLVTVGLDDSTEQVQKIVSGWDAETFHVSVCQFGWQDSSRSTAETKNDYLQNIRLLHEQFGSVALVGVSAGGAASIWGAEQLPDMVDTVIDVCGAVKLPRLTLVSKYFGSNGERFDEVLKDIQNISPETLNKLTILRPLLYDGLVRGSSFRQQGATIRTLPLPTHIVAINWALKNVIPRMLVS